MILFYFFNYFLFYFTKSIRPHCTLPQLAQGCGVVELSDHGMIKLTWYIGVQYPIEIDNKELTYMK
jgi:hypothetical protein